MTVHCRENTGKTSDSTERTWNTMGSLVFRVLFAVWVVGMIVVAILMTTPVKG